MADSDPSWSNWSGCVVCAPRCIERPGSEREVVETIRRAQRERLAVRVAGAGHSQVPLVATDGILLSLEELRGLVDCDPASREARVRAGTRLSALGEQLLARGLAMENLGDIDVQALAGALATGTHGTGRTLRNLSSQVRSLRFVTAEGEVVEWSDERDADRLRAARVSLGAFGVVTEVRLGLIEAFRLHERIDRVGVDECLEQLEARIADSRHFEFFWYPARDRIDAKSLHPTEAQPGPVPDRPYERVDWSSRILPSVREDRFVEMEYAIPELEGPAVFRALRERIQRRHPGLLWPVEYRTLAADDAWLSPAYERASVTLSVHQDARLPYAELFEDLEPLLLAAGGRPHWGKWHACGAGALGECYPRWDHFRALREEIDPDGRFLNAHLSALLLD